MILSFHPCFTADHQIILGDRSLNEADRRLIRSAHAVILHQGRADGSHEAEGVFVVTGPTSLKAALAFLALKEGGENNGFVTQDFVASGGNVLRPLSLFERLRVLISF